MISLLTLTLCLLLKSTFFHQQPGFYRKMYFSDKVNAILIEEVPVKTMLVDGTSFPRLTSLIQLKYLHQPSNFVLL